MFPSTSFQKNLHLPESGINFALNIFFFKAGLIDLLNPLDFNTSCNIPLLKKIDESKSTLGKISFLPLDFIHEFLLKKNLLPTKNYLSDLERKNDYVKIINQFNLINNDFLENNTYKNIPLKYFRKSILFSSLTKTVDSCKIETDPGDNFLTDLNVLKIPVVNVDEIVVRNENEWLSKNDLLNIIYPNLFSLSKKKQDEIFFFPFIYLKNPFYTVELTYSSILHSYDWNSIPKNKRFVIFFILYRSHFTSVIVDTQVPRKNKTISRFAYFFNSTGYNPSNFVFNKNNWFIDNSSKILNHKEIKTEYFNDNNYMLPIEALSHILKNVLNVTNFVYNTFSIQNFDSECGIFSSFFLYTFLNLVDSVDDIEEINISKMKHLYFNMLTVGCDLTYSMFRGLLYFTQEDLKLNGLKDNEYLNSISVYKIKNRKTVEYINIYYQNCLFFEKLYKKIEKTKLDIETNCLEYLLK